MFLLFLKERKPVPAWLILSLCLTSSYVTAQDKTGKMPPPKSLEKAIKLADHYYEQLKLDSSLVWAKKALTLAQQYQQPNYEVDARGIVGNIYLETNQYHKALKAFDKNLTYFLIIKDHYYVAACFFNMAIAFSKLGKYKKATQNYTSCLKIFKLINKERLVAQTLNSLGAIHELQDQYQQAIYYHLKALKIYEKSNDRLGLSDSYNNLGLLEWKLGNFKTSEKFYQKSYAIARQLQDISGQVSPLIGLGNTSAQRKAYSDAENYYKKALKISYQIKNPESVADNLHNLGNLAQEQKKYPEALSYHKKALAIRTKLLDPERINLSTYNLASVYFKSKNYVLAIQYAQSSLTQARALDNKLRISNALRIISEIYYANVEYKKAYDFQKKCHAYLDSTLDETKVKAIEKLKAIYEDEKKQDSIRLLNKENKIKGLNLAKQRDSIRLKQVALEVLQKDKDLQEIFFKQEQQKKDAHLQRIALEKAQQTKLYRVEQKNREQEINLLSKNNQLQASSLKNAQLQKRNLLITGGIITLLLITVAGGLFLTQRQRVRLTKEKLRRQNVISQFENLKLQVNPHFLLNSLNALASLIQQDAQRAHEFTLQFSKLYLFVLELKDNLLVSLEDELKFCKAYLALQQVRFGQNLKVDYQINADQSQVSLPPLALQIALENAVKHNQITEQAPLRIRIFSEAKKLVVQNNLQKKASHIVNSTHIGVQNIKERYKLIGKEQPEFIENATDFTVKLPLSS